MLFPDDDVEDYIDDDAEADENVRGTDYDNADEGKDGWCYYEATDVSW